MRRPPPLEPGAAVAIVAPAGPVRADQIEASLRALSARGFVPRAERCAFGADRERPYFSGSDRERARAFHGALADDSIGAVWFARGGYGTARLLDRLDPSAWRARPKWVAGFSDATAFHLWSARHGVESLHAPVAKSVPLLERESPGDLEALWRAWRDPDWAPRFEGLRCVRPGRIEGPVYGGNLCLIASMLGSEAIPALDGAILILEEVGEADYRLDRLLDSVRRAAPRLGGLVLGDFTRCGGVFIEEARITEFAASLGAEFACPVACGLPVGHGARNAPWPHGRSAELDASAGVLAFAPPPSL